MICSNSVPSPSTLLNHTRSHFYKSNSWAIATSPQSSRSIRLLPRIAQEKEVISLDSIIVSTKSRRLLSKTQIFEDDNTIEVENCQLYEFHHDNRTYHGGEQPEETKISSFSKEICSQSDITTLYNQKNIYSNLPTLRLDKWVEPPATNFRIRGKTYNKDSEKVQGKDYMLHLFAVDILKVEVPLLNGVCLHPNERVQIALQREKEATTRGDEYKDIPKYIVAINIFLQGPPHYHLMIYLGVDDRSIINGSNGLPSSQLAAKFFFGTSNEFRDKTFKLIPQVVKGNYLVRKSVGRKPCIMGKSITQTYVQHQRFFEIILNTGSSTLAKGVVKLCRGYTKSIEVEMGFLLEGNEESQLPERMLGAVRLKQLDLNRDIRVC